MKNHLEYLIVFKQVYKYVEIQFECMNSYGEYTHIETFSNAKKSHEIIT